MAPIRMGPQMTAVILPRDSKPTDAEMQQRRNRKRQRNLEVAALQATALNEPSALLHMATVNAAVGLGPTAIYDRIRAGTFPPPVRLSARCSRWRAGDVRTWLAAQLPSEA